MFEEEVRIDNVMQFHDVDVSQWPRGIYLLKTQIEKKEIVRKIIIE